jgi:hypothetical protein
LNRRAAATPIWAAFSLVAACGTSHEPQSNHGAKPVAGGTGSFAVVAVGGTQKLYLPQYGTSTEAPSLAVVDMGAPGEGVRGVPGRIASIDLGAARGDDDYATVTAGDSTIVVAASTVSPTIWFVDPQTDELLGKTRLDDSYGQTTFGGNGGYVTSVAMDSAHGRALLSVWNGMAVVDVRSRSIERVVPAPPSENIAFDPVRQWVLAPFYDCASSLDSHGNTPAACAKPRAQNGSPMTDGLSVVDLKDDAVYTFQYEGSDVAGAPVGTMPASAAIDSATGLAVVASKGRLDQTIIDFSRAHFDEHTRWVDAPATVLRGNALGDVAIASPDHLAFWEGEHASDVAGARLPTLAPTTEVTTADAGDAGSLEPDYVFGRMPALPDGTAWKNAPSSHGVAVWPGSADIGAFGVTVSEDYRWVARIDLKALIALPSDYHETSEVTNAVTLFDAQTSVDPRR